jgi:hypothetical protein
MAQRPGNRALSRSARRPAVLSACGAPEFRKASRNSGGSLLQKALDEERATDKKMTTLAESKINLRAAS